MRAALAAGKTVAVPRVDNESRMLELHAITDPVRDVVAGYRDIPEPLPACPLVARDTIDFVLVPGVAFDRRGRRMGYGGGYYDRLLPLLSPRAARVAGAFEVQLVDRVPAAPNDIAVDAIVTEFPRVRAVSAMSGAGTAACARSRRTRTAAIALAVTLAIQIFTALAATSTSVLAPVIGRDLGHRRPS